RTPSFTLIGSCAQEEISWKEKFGIKQISSLHPRSISEKNPTRKEQEPPLITVISSLYVVINSPIASRLHSDQTYFYPRENNFIDRKGVLTTIFFNDLVSSGLTLGSPVT